MVRITKKDVFDIARLSLINVHKDEVSSLCSHIDEVLQYAESVQKIAQKNNAKEIVMQHENRFREDVVINQSKEETIVECAAKHEGNFFVVPIILDTKSK